MPLLGYAVVLLSSLLLAIFAFRQYRSTGALSRFLIQLICILAYAAGVVYVFGSNAAPAAKGASEVQGFTVAVILLYICVLFGMVAESLYSWFGKTPARRRSKFDWGTMIRPILISPLILIPTVAAFQNANIDLTKLGYPWLLTMLTAFEKGFLWKRFMAKTGGDAGSKRGEKAYA